MKALVIILFIVVLVAGCAPQHSLTLEADPAKGTVSGEGEYPEGETVELAATPLEGFDLVSWSIEGVVISEEANFTYAMPAEDVTIEANFEKVNILSLFDLGSGARFEDGKLFISWRDGDGLAVATYDEEQLSDFILEVDIEQTDGAIAIAQGFGIRRNPETLEEIRLTIMPVPEAGPGMGFFEVSRGYGKAEFANIYARPAPHLNHEGKNRIRVEAIGDSISLFANDELVFEVSGVDLHEGGIAFYTGRGEGMVSMGVGEDLVSVEWAFSNLVIKEP